jgi:hypothetical protein
MDVVSLPNMSAETCDLFAQWAWVGAGPHLLTGIDRATRTVWLVPAGMWTVADVDRFFPIQKRINETARARYGRLDLLMDLRWSVVVPQDTSVRLTQCSADLYTDRDRFALVMESALLKMQLRRSFTVGTSEVVETPEEGLAWLRSAAPVGA